MKYKNTDNAVLKIMRISDVSIGTKVVFYDDYLIQDIHVIGDVNGEFMVTSVVEVGDSGYDFTHDPDRKCYILEPCPTRQGLLFDED